MIEQPLVGLRRATSADVPLLRRWDDKPHVIGATGADGGSDWNWEYELPREVTWRELLIGEVNGRPVASCRSLIRKVPTGQWRRCLW